MIEYKASCDAPVGQRFVTISPNQPNAEEMSRNLRNVGLPNMFKFVTKDSGQREQYSTGMVRDTRSGKGRFDLIPAEALKRLAGVYERGSVKYGDNNWRKGAPYSRFIDSALRHINSYLLNEQSQVEQDEDHLSQAVFNLFALIYLEEKMPEMNDLRPTCE